MEDGRIQTQAREVTGDDVQWEEQEARAYEGQRSPLEYAPAHQGAETSFKHLDDGIADPEHAR